MRDLVIIGGGAASQAAAMYALGKQIDFLLVCDRFGGRVGPAAPADRDYLVGSILVHYDSPDHEDAEQQLIGSSAVRVFERQIAHQPGRVLYDKAVGLRRDGPEFVVETEHGAVVRSGAVLLATGAAPRALAGVPGNHLVKPLGHRCTHSGAALAGKAVAVIGASEQALYTAAELARSARMVYLVLPTVQRAERPEMAMLQRQSNIEVLPGYGLIEVRGEGTVSEIMIGAGGEVITLEVQAAFADMGYAPASSLVRNMVKTGSDGFIQVDRGFATSVPGLFAAGDVTRPEGEQVLAAIGDGARAARSAHFYLLTRPTAFAVGQGR
jgi:thioredoxin reductase (NADPH)